MFALQDWQSTIEAFGYIREMVTQLLALQVFRQNKEAWLRETQVLFNNAAYAFSKLGLLEEAVEAIEEGRARLLSEGLEQHRNDLERLRDLGYSDLYERYEKAAATWNALTQQKLQEAQMRQPDALVNVNVAAVRTAMQAAITAIRAVPGYEDFLARSPFARIQACVTSSPLIYIIVTNIGGLALILRPQGTTIVSLWLPDCTEQRVREHLLEMHAALATYTQDQQNQHALDNWLTTLDAVTHWLWQALMGVLVDALASASRVTLVPGGLLGLFPLHAAWTHDLETPTHRLYALDRLLVTYIPNARTLEALQEHAESISVDALLAVDDPRPVSHPLGNAYEVRIAQSDFPRTRLFQGEEALREVVLHELPKYPVVHFNCHGYANVAEPLESGLVMAHEELLTLRDLLALRMQGVRLAVLSACETAIPGIVLPDEVINLPTGLLQAGIAGVVASLWKVEYISTMILMILFYTKWQRGAISPAEALRQAQIWVRDTTTHEKLAYFERFSQAASPTLSTELLDQIYQTIFFSLPDKCAHPFYWAAFGYIGGE